MIKAIIFDCFGVLTEDKWRAFRESIKDENTANAAQSLNHAYDRGFITKQEFVTETARLTGVDSDFLNSLLDNEQSKNVALLDWIRTQRSSYKIGLLSNVGTNWIEESLLTKEEYALFDVKVLSFQVGLTKPSTEIFLLAASRLGVRPDECLFIDDVESYCLAANNTGMLTIYYQTLEGCLTQAEALLSSNS